MGCLRLGLELIQKGLEVGLIDIIGVRRTNDVDCDLVEHGAVVRMIFLHHAPYPVCQIIRTVRFPEDRAGDLVREMVRRKTLPDSAVRQGPPIEAMSPLKIMRDPDQRLDLAIREQRIGCRRPGEFCV